MSLENEISQLTKSINELNANFERFFNAQSAPTPQAQPTPISEPEQAALLPDVAKTMNRTRDELQAMCLAATKRNAANRDIIKSIMLNNFEARKSSDLADNQVDMCYAMIAEATQDD
ncbi:MAG TPA: hypothetical protein PLQ39_12885 [Acinetobacter sp.]|nr:hypothetical protein [Acinetobacter sp.]